MEPDLTPAVLPDVDPSLRPAHSPLRVLSLTGGGYRGLFSAQVLVDLCQRARANGALTNRFQVFAGTSIGGIMACALAVGVAPRRVLDAIDLHGPIIFAPRRMALLKRLFSGAIYDHDDLSAAIKACLGPHANRSLRDVEAGLVVPAVDWSRGRAEVFMSGAMGVAHAAEVTLHDVCMATSAAPTYFRPHKLNGTPMLDGGLVANNPDVLALTEIMRRWPHMLDRVEMLSIGTAGSDRLRLPDEADRSLAGWARELPLFLISAQEATATSQAERLLGDRYLRINHQPSAGVPAFDQLDVSDDGARTRLLKAAQTTAQKAYAKHRAFIDRMLSLQR
jgi:uncharacterized protein